MKKVIKINESQLHNIIKERIDWTGKWIPDKESPFDKAKEYSLKKDLVKELTVREIFSVGIMEINNKSLRSKI